MHSVYYDIVIIRMDKGFTSGFLYVVMEKNYYSAIRSEGYKTLVEGQYVKFELIRTDKGLQAKNVIELKTALV